VRAATTPRGPRRRTPRNRSRSSDPRQAHVLERQLGQHAQLGALAPVVVDHAVDARRIFDQEVRHQHRLLERRVPLQHVLQAQRQGDQHREALEPGRLGVLGCRQRHLEDAAKVAVLSEQLASLVGTERDWVWHHHVPDLAGKVMSFAGAREARPLTPPRAPQG
jgi:hypothetical protein